MIIDRPHQDRPHDDVPHGWATDIVSPDGASLTLIDVVMDLADRIGLQLTLRNDAVAISQAAQGDLNDLTTTERTTLVAALNEMVVALVALRGTVTANTAALARRATSDQIVTAIASLRTEIRNGALADSDSFFDIAEQIDALDIGATQALMAQLVRYEPQSLAPEARTRARLNMGAASAEELTAVDAKIGAGDPMGAFNAYFAA